VWAEAADEVADSGREAADDEDLESAAVKRKSGDAAFERTESEQGESRGGERERDRGVDAEEEVGPQGMVAAMA
jgi:hypothetical protein